MGEERAPTAAPHQPVMLAEVLRALMPLKGARVVDGTFGAGGYSRALLEAGALVRAIDRDPDVVVHAEVLRQQFGESFQFLAGNFSAIDELAEGWSPDGVVLDIGVSSMQLDEAGRGFSFLKEGPLDMRMAQSGMSAADLVNGLSETDLANLLFAYGEERKSRRIAHAIVTARDTGPIATTTELAWLIEAAVGRKPGDIHPATRSFQALRIAVNEEFDELVEGLFAAERVLGAGGRLAVVAFHSLEDRIVKRFLDPEKSAGPRSRHAPEVEAPVRPWIEVARPLKADPAEVTRNPRARSATLRSARRSATPARQTSREGLGVPGFRGTA